jgi:hypothetical protein
MGHVFSLTCEEAGDQGTPSGPEETGVGGNARTVRLRVMNAHRLAAAALAVFGFHDAEARVSADPGFGAVYAGLHWGAGFDFPGCYQWSPLEITVQGTTVEVVQRVERSACPGSHPGTAQTMPRVPAGPHTFVYRQVTSTGVDINPEFRVSFIVRTGASGITFWPADPVALEPVDITIDDDTCFELRSPRFENGGITLVRQYVTDNFIQCDGISRKRITLGAFPPGDYSIRLETKFLGRPVELTETAVLRVRPGPVVPQGGIGPPFAPEADGVFRTERDLSGLWSVRGQPGDGVQIVHAHSPSSNDQYSRIAMVWYTYDAAQLPVWYFAELTAFSGTFSGKLHAVRGDGTRAEIGDVTLSFPMESETRPGVLVFTTGSTRVEHVIEKLRWNRSAWLPWQTPAR